MALVTIASLLVAVFTARDAVKYRIIGYPT
jgi:hypothetical protein